VPGKATLAHPTVRRCTPVAGALTACPNPAVGTAWSATSDDPLGGRVAALRPKGEIAGPRAHLPCSHTSCYWWN
jgi:hypothetical protein